MLLLHFIFRTIRHELVHVFKFFSSCFLIEIADEPEYGEKDVGAWKTQTKETYVITLCVIFFMTNEVVIYNYAKQ